ncbi:hypothetical protein HK101_007362 [Irineochytrium annulatum]|nr:hypothetical protein HK101_007362 [Irineochytrium annulatum]
MTTPAPTTAKPVKAAKATKPARSNPWMTLWTEPVHRPENPFKLLAKLNGRQWLIFLAAFLGWSMDACDYFIVTLVVNNIAKEFDVTNSTVTNAITITLLFRPIGALIFGLAGDKWGRKWPLMVDVCLYALFELLSGFAPNLAVFLVLRALFGVALGGEWGLGASLALEAVPPETRGIMAGILQQGYATGNLMASALYYAVSTNPNLSWRVLFYIGSFPALLVILIRFAVPESEAYERQKERREESGANFLKDLGVTFRTYWKRAVFCIVLMSCFNFFSHGSQDLYPTYITALGYSANDKAATTAIASFGAILGGTFVGFIGQYAGRRRAMMASAVCAGALIYPWAFSDSLGGLKVSAFWMQFFVQGAWGVVPAYLTELSPPSIRATFPGLVYNIGNMISAASATIESKIGEQYPTTINGKSTPNYGLTQAIFMAVTVCALLVVLSIGSEARGRNFIVGDVVYNEDLDTLDASPVPSKLKDEEEATIVTDENDGPADGPSKPEKVAEKEPGDLTVE